MSLTKTLIVAGLCQAILLAGNALATWLTDRTGALSWAITPVISIVVAMLQALVEAERSPAPAPDRPRPAAGGGTPLWVVLVVVVLVIGVGGLVVTWGVRTAIGYLTGNEPGMEHLLRPRAHSEQGLSVRVVSVKFTDHFTRVEVETRNGTSNTLSLPLFGFASFVGSDGSTLEADAFRSDWSDQLPPGSFKRGTITFKGHLPATVRRASLSFSTVFKQGFEGPDSITVSGLRITKNPRTTSAVRRLELHSARAA